MIFTPLELQGAYIIELEKKEDERGVFARSFCQDEFRRQGLNPAIAQCNISFNRHKGTLRGMHFQAPPVEEDKLVRCTRGAICDVIVDIRRESKTYCRWASTELTAGNHRMLFVPRGFAHGFQTLEDRSEVFYQMSEFYDPRYARGIRWDDPAIGIEWPLKDPVISDKDRSYEDFRP
jgi:dTDP-4-dehydrorhamnose 3,5-epimerase